MAQYTYDEQGFNFYYFLISVLSLGLVPVTLQSLYSGIKSGCKFFNIYTIYFIMTEGDCSL
jgi:preprotein translocase subunit Sec63